MNKCEFNKEENPCVHLIRETSECIYQGTCTFREKEKPEHDPYVRKPRWYEKYYNNSYKKDRR